MYLPEILFLNLNLGVLYDTEPVTKYLLSMNLLVDYIAIDIPLLHIHLLSNKIATVDASLAPLQYAKHVEADMESNVMSIVAVYSIFSRK